MQEQITEIGVRDFHTIVQLFKNLHQGNEYPLKCINYFCMPKII